MKNKLNKFKLENLIKQNLSITQIADVTGVPKGQIQNLFTKYGLKTLRAQRVLNNQKLLPFGKKQCAECNQVFQLENFRKAQNQDGHNALCIICHRKIEADRSQSKYRDSTLEHKERYKKEIEEGLRARRLCPLCDKVLWYPSMKFCGGPHRRFAKRMKDYGCSLDEAKKAFQIRQCEICNYQFKDDEYSCIDHNHKTMKFRGILCSHCNLAVGHLKDNVGRAEKLIAYLQSSQTEFPEIKDPRSSMTCLLCDKPRGYRMRKFCSRTCEEKSFRIKNKYKISIAQYRWLVDRQQNKCLCCGDEFGDGNSSQIDHCHNKGYIKGLLCAGCNSAAGNLKDDLGLAISLRDYLMRS